METADLKKRDGQIGFGMSAYKRLPGNRAHALDAAGEEAIGGLAKEYFAANGGVGTEGEYGKVLLELGDYVPGLFQPEPDAQLKLPEWPRHPITGELMPNPWEKGHESLTTQSKLLARDPELAKAMKMAAENPWQYFFDVEEEKQKREHVAAIKYGESDHAHNPYVHGGLTEQNELQKRDPVRAEIFKREAQPLKLPFAPGSVNETIRGQLYIKAPKLYQWTERARTTCEQWQAERIATLKAAEEKARQDREQLEKQLRREEAA
jgi:hypothetical protein